MNAVEVSQAKAHYSIL